jgi:uncharacterized protein YqeY
MPLSKQTIRDDLTAAMKVRDGALTATLRMLLAAVGNAEVAGKEHVELSEDRIVALVRAETKKRNESAAIYEEAGRAELAAQERSEAAILARYLPAEMSDADLEAIVADAVAAAGAAGQSGPSAMGAVMKAVRERVGSGADGARVSSAVKAALAGT